MSQNGQDQWVVNYFKKQCGSMITGGFFVDVGAYDGRMYSNTALMEHEYLWDGLCYEPDPEVFLLLIQRRECACINKAVSNYNGAAPFQINHDRTWSGLLGYARELQHKPVLDTITVPVVTLADEFAERGIEHIDYLSIDAEGADLNVLHGIDFDKVEITVISVEVNKADDKAIHSLLSDAGYTKAAMVGVDAMYTLW